MRSNREYQGNNNTTEQNELDPSTH